jgi:hypothetical protein
MAMAQATQTASRALYRRRAVASQNVRTAEMPLFQAFLRFSHQGTTDCRCIKDGTPIDPAYHLCKFLTLLYTALTMLSKFTYETGLLRPKFVGNPYIFFVKHLRQWCGGCHCLFS